MPIQCPLSVRLTSCSGKLTAKPSLPILENLQGLRGFAACCLLFRHAIHEVQVNTDLAFDPHEPHFTIGIDLFFVLSGFIMVYTAQKLFGQKGAWKTFMLRRIIRIVPLYWFYTCVFGLIALLVPQILASIDLLTLSGFVKSLFFIPYENADGYMKPFFDLGWTLNYEMFFYTVFAVFIFLRMPWMIIALSAFFLTGYMLRSFGISDDIFFMFYTRPLVMEFMFGAWIGFLFINDIRLPAFMRIPCYALCVCLFGLIMFPDLIGGMNHYGGKAMLIASCFVACLTLPRGAESQKLPKWLKNIGDSSYTIYLSHPFALGAVTQGVILLGLQNTLSPWFVFALCIGVAIIGGYIAYLIIEKPMTRGLKHLIVKRQQTGSADIS